MKRLLFNLAFVLSFSVLWSCRQKPNAPATAEPATETNTLPATTDRTGNNNYKVFFKTLRQNTEPAAGFRVDAHVKGKSQPATKKTDATGIAEFTDLPFPDTTHQLVAVLHYYNGKVDGAREITYPYIESDAMRLKDTQYIPNNATPEP